MLDFLNSKILKNSNLDNHSQLEFPIIQSYFHLKIFWKINQLLSKVGLVILYHKLEFSMSYLKKLKIARNNSFL